MDNSITLYSGILAPGSVDTTNTYIPASISWRVDLKEVVPAASVENYSAVVSFGTGSGLGSSISNIEYSRDGIIWVPAIGAGSSVFPVTQPPSASEISNSNPIATYSPVTGLFRYLKITLSTIGFEDTSVTPGVWYLGGGRVQVSLHYYTTREMSLAEIVDM